MSEEWLIDQETCTVKHFSGFAVRFEASDILATALVGEVVSPAPTGSDTLLLLKEAGTIYAALRAGRH